MNEFLQIKGKKYVEVPGNFLMVIDFSDINNLPWSSCLIHEFTFTQMKEADF